MRFYNYALIIVGIILFLNFAGFSTPLAGGLAGSLGLVNNTAGASAVTEVGINNFTASGIWIKFLAILTGLVAVGLVAGLFGRAPDIRYSTAAIVVLLTTALVVDLTSIYSLFGSVAPWMRNIVGLLIGGLIVGLLISALQFWQGTD
jgi:hypothetical protein